MNHKIELLSPAGSFEVLRACIQAGADAVYMGLSKFSARAYADNADVSNYIMAIEYVHLHGKRLYLTINTLFKEKELFQELFDLLLPLYKAGLDGVIVQDLGVMAFVQEHFPGLEIHASTQATILNASSLQFYKRLGVSRIVPARELSLEEIRDLKKERMEVECFVHGALCYSYSGQCLFSSVIGGRSGNRGKCAQPCRLSYSLKNQNGKFCSKKSEPNLLSLKDLNTLSLLPEFVDAGIDSLKIEGRMKKAEYAAGVTSIYRKYLDLIEDGKPYKVSEKDEKRLWNLFNRQGFTKGYYHTLNSGEMITKKPMEFRREDEAFINEIREKYMLSKKRIPLIGKYFFRQEEQFRMEIQVPGLEETLQITSDPEIICTIANHRATTVEEVERQLKKTGDSEFAFQVLEGELEEGLFLPVSLLNAFRRKCLEFVYEAIQKQYRREES